jgi:hypothetical protein
MGKDKPTIEAGRHHGKWNLDLVCYIYAISVLIPLCHK